MTRAARLVWRESAQYKRLVAAVFSARGFVMTEEPIQGVPEDY